MHMILHLLQQRKDIPPAGKESHELHGQERSPVARLIIIEDADHLGIEGKLICVG